MKKLLLALVFCMASIIGTNAMAEEDTTTSAMPEQTQCKPNCDGIPEGKCECKEMDGNQCCTEKMDDSQDGDKTDEGTDDSNQNNDNMEDKSDS